MTPKDKKSRKEKCRVLISSIKNNTQSIGGLYFMWIFIHFVTSHLYSQFCTPYSVQGFFMSPFLTASPQCNALRWGIEQGAVTINNMWLLVGAWLVAKVSIKQIKKD